MLFSATGVPSWVVVLSRLVLWLMGACFLAAAGLRVAHYAESIAQWMRQCDS